MPWAEVTDPTEIAVALTSDAGGGKPKISGAENVELVKARQANQGGRDMFPALANMYRVAARYPGGIPQAEYDRARTKVGSQAAKAQDFDLFNIYANRAAIGKARLLAPVSNNDMKMLVKSSANPTLRFQNNQELIGLEYSNGARQYLDNYLKQKWLAKNGGTNTPNARGQSYDEWRSQLFRNPNIVRQITPPWAREPLASKKDAGNADRNGDGVVDFKDLK